MISELSYSNYLILLKLKAKSESEALMLAQRTQELREELKHKPRRIDPDSADGFVAEDESDKLPELTG